MRATLVRVVEQPDVAILHAGATFGGHAHGGAHGKGHRADKHRQSGLALDQRVAGLRVIQAVAGVVRLGNDGVERAAVQRGVHLVGNLLQPPAQHRKRHRIQNLFSHHGVHSCCVV